MINVLMIGMLFLSTLSSFLASFYDAAVKKRENRVGRLVLLAICSLLILFVIFMPVSDTSRLNAGIGLLNTGEYLNAQRVFEELGDQEMLSEAQYAYAKHLLELGNWDTAIEIFTELGDYKDSQQYLQQAKLALSYSNSQIVDEEDIQAEQDKMYSLAYQYYNAGQYIQALNYFKILNGYKDSDTMIATCITAARKAAGCTISAGIKSALAIKNDGTIVYAGDSNYFDFSQWRDIISISHLGSIAIGLKSDGAVVSTGPYSVNVDDWCDIVSISAGERYVIGLKSDGTVIGTG